MSDSIDSIKSTLQPYKQALKDFIRPAYYRIKYGQMAFFLNHAFNVPGFLGSKEAAALMEAAHSLPENAIIAEVGSFLGKSATVLAGARKAAGSGYVCCIDPFDGSGDDHSIPYYEEIDQISDLTLRQRFDRNINRAGLKEWVKVFPGTGQSVGRNWNQSLDLLFLDGDQSPAGARETFDVWCPFLKRGGILAIHNSADVIYAPGHDGQRRLVVEEVKPPAYSDIYRVESTTFATKNF